MVKNWNIGILEEWNIDFQWIEKWMVFPIFHHSNIPSFRVLGRDDG